MTELFFKIDFVKPTDVLSLLRDENDLFTPFAWQQDVEDLAHEQFVSLTASTGAGKSHAIKIHAKSWGGKTIIVVPKLAIGQEFESCSIKTKSGDVVWFDSINLCKASADSSIQELVNFIENRGDNTEYNKIIVVCAPTLVGAFEKCDKRKWKGIRLIFDEAHHVSTGEDEGGTLNPNSLGAIMDKTIRGKTNSIMLVTATHFRGDRYTIIPSKYEKKFVDFDVSFQRVQDECRMYNKNISFGYTIYKDDVSESIGKIFNPNQKTIIFANRANAAGTKQKKDDYVRNAIKEMGFKIIEEDKTRGSFVVKKGNKKLIIADLIHPDRSTNAAKYIHHVSKVTKTFEIDVIFALERFKEGCDYPPLQHCIIDGIRDSYGDIIQMFGRVTRDDLNNPNKTFCHATIMIANRLGFTEDDVTTKTQTHLNFLVSCLCLPDFFQPYYLRMKDKQSSGGGTGGVTHSPLSCLGNRGEQNDFMEKALKKFIAYTHDKPEFNKKSKKGFAKRLVVMTGFVKDMLEPKLKYNAENVATQILIEMAAMMKVNDGGMDISELNVELLEKVDTTQFAHQFLSKFLNSKELTEFKKHVHNHFGEDRTLEEYITTAREHANHVGESWERIHARHNLGEQGYRSSVNAL